MRTGSVLLETLLFFFLCMKVNALHLTNAQLSKGFLPWIIRSTCVAQMTVSVCNQPQGTDWILPAHDGDALQCNGCSAGFPESQSPRIRQGMRSGASGWPLLVYDCPYPNHINLLIARTDIIRCFHRNKKKKEEGEKKDQQAIMPTGPHEEFRAKDTKTQREREKWKGR